MSWRDLTRGPWGGPDWQWIGISIVIALGLSTATLTLDPWGLGVPLTIFLGVVLVVVDVWIRRRPVDNKKDGDPKD